MPPKVKIEDVLPSGERISIVLEGPRISKSRVLQVLDMIDLMGGGAVENDERQSLKDKIWEIILEKFGDSEWFTLKDAYRAVKNCEPEIELTTVASYLTRLVNEGKLTKKGRKPATLYKVHWVAAKP